MSHRVVQFQAKVTSSSKASTLKDEAVQKLDSKNYDMYERSVVDGSDPEGNATVSVTTKHNITKEADEFSTWLKNWADSNKASFNSDGTVNTEGFNWVNHKVHDCYHLIDGVSEPCMVQDSKTYDLR